MARQWAILLLFLGVSVAFAVPEVHEASVKEVANKKDDISDDKLEEQPEEGEPKPETVHLVDMGDTEKQNSATSILNNLWDNIAAQLHSPQRPWSRALIAFIFGVPLLTDSLSCFDLIIVATNSVLACVLAQSEVSSKGHVDHTHPLALFVGIQVAVLSAWVTYKAIEGVRLIYVTLLGAALAVVLQMPLVLAGVDQLEDSKWALAVYYSFFCWLALGVYKKNLHGHILAVICSLLGGALITSAFAWAAAFCLLTQGHSAAVHPVGGDWVDFFFLLFTPGAKDLGVFAGSSKSHSVDIIADRTMWFVLTSFGILFQFQRMKRTSAGPAKAREGLRQKLLVAEL